MVGAIALSGLGFLAGHAAAGPSHRPAPPRDRIYVVRPGDTLWGIALRIGGTQSDPRPLVDELVSMNHVADGAIVPGERLVLPSGRS